MAAPRASSPASSSGATDLARGTAAGASCQAADAFDAGGNKVRYDPGNVYDEDMTTAWRCDGDGSGEKLTIDLADPTKIGEVGLIPGYAKTDPRSGVDRYAENDRIRKVRWVFDDGTAVEQTFDTSAKNRSMQSMRIPVTKADRVVVEILGAERGPQHRGRQRGPHRTGRRLKAPPRDARAPAGERRLGVERVVNHPGLVQPVMRASHRPVHPLRVAQASARNPDAHQVVAVVDPGREPVARHRPAVGRNIAEEPAQPVGGTPQLDARHTRATVRSVNP